MTLNKCVEWDVKPCHSILYYIILQNRCTIILRNMLTLYYYCVHCNSCSCIAAMLLLATRYTCTGVMNYVVSDLARRIIIPIQESHSKGLVALRICLRLLKVKRSISCYVKHSMLVWSSLSARHTLLAKTMLSSGMIFITKQAEPDSELLC